MTRAEYLALIDRVLEDMVRDGIFRVARIDEKGRKFFVLTEAGRSPHLILDAPRTKQ
jgi:hypothetical protein